MPFWSSKVSGVPLGPVAATTAASSCPRRLLVLLLAALLLAAPAWAEGIKVLSAGTQLDQGLYRLNARLEYELSQAPTQALHNGVPLTFMVQMEVLRRRTWTWDESLAHLQQRYTVEYHALARQYVVTNLNNRDRNSFPDLAAALAFISQIDDFPFLDASLLTPGSAYYGRLRASLDLDVLPAPLLLVAYLSGEWHLSSEWYTWPL